MQYIAPDSPAAAAGLKEHDILQKVNDQLIINFEQLHVLIRSKKAGEKVKLTVLRQGSEKQLDAKLSSRDVASASPEGAHGSAIYGYIPTPDGKKLELSFHPDHPHDLPKEVREHIEEELKKHHPIPHGKGDKNYIRKLPGNIPDDVRKLIEEQIKKRQERGHRFLLAWGQKRPNPPEARGRIKKK